MSELSHHKDGKDNKSQREKKKNSEKISPLASSAITTTQHVQSTAKWRRSARTGGAITVQAPTAVKV